MNTIDSVLAVLADAWRCVADLFAAVDSPMLESLAFGVTLWVAGILADRTLAWGRVPAPPRIWNAERTPLPAHVRCPVCSGTRMGAWMVCPDCETPHHQDCLEYNAGCAVYGCRAAPPGGLYMLVPGQRRTEGA